MNWASLVLRFGLGFMFVGHGLQKALGFLGGPGPKGFAGFLASLGFSNSLLWAYITGYSEMICGLCLILGLMVRSSSLVLLLIMGVALAKVHISKGFFLQAGGFEYVFVISTALIALLILGAGKFSLLEKY
jgi:putative oxidoreductase